MLSHTYGNFCENRNCLLLELVGLIKPQPTYKKKLSSSTLQKLRKCIYVSKFRLSRYGGASLKCNPLSYLTETFISLGSMSVTPGLITTTRKTLTVTERRGYDVKPSPDASTCHFS
jgi:hypothetical protein